jgi:hypothetical protein
VQVLELQVDYASLGNSSMRASQKTKQSDRKQSINNESIKTITGSQMIEFDLLLSSD